jgi:hypothetical protein
VWRGGERKGRRGGGGGEERVIKYGTYITCKKKITESLARFINKNL